MLKNKRGWIRIVEAFVAILLITGVLLVLINKGYIGGKDISEKVYAFQLSALREIQLNDNLRNEVLNVPNSVIPLESNLPGFPPTVKSAIVKKTPSYLECKSKICFAERICSLDSYVEKDVYAEAVVISANLTNYNPRQVKIFCWGK